MQVEPAITTAKKEASTSNQLVLGLNVEYTDRNAVRAQRICNALTSLIVDENLRLGSDLAHTTVDFLPRQLKLAKDDLEHKRAQLRVISKSPSPRSPKEEATYKALALDYANAHAFYKDLLAKTNTAELHVGGDSQPPLVEHVRIDTADLPEAPSFTNRPLFSLCGLGAGLLLGIGRLLWFTESSDMLLYLAGVNEHAVLRIVGSNAMERSTFSEDNSVPFRIQSSLPSNLTLLYEP